MRNEKRERGVKLPEEKKEEEESMHGG